jgi:hypothetical protein
MNTKKLPRSTAGKIVPRFKTPEELEARNQFLAGAEAARQGDLWSTTDLKRMDMEGLLNRLDMIDAQSHLLKWRVWHSIRAHFKSDKLFGQYLQELREKPEYAEYKHLVTSQQDINRAALAGAFCEKHSINDLNYVGIRKSAIYALSRPANADVADKIFHAVKRKSLPVAEVERLIAEAKSIPGAISVVPERIDYTAPSADTAEPVMRRRTTIEIVGRVAQIPEVLSQKDEAISDMLSDAFAKAAPTEEQPEVINYGEVEEVDIDAAMDSFAWRPGFPDRRAAPTRRAEPVKVQVPETVYIEKPASLTTVAYDELILEIATREYDTAELTQQQRVSEILLTDERFGLSSAELIVLHNHVIKSYQKLIELNK